MKKTFLGDDLKLSKIWNGIGLLLVMICLIGSLALLLQIKGPYLVTVTVSFALSGYGFLYMRKKEKMQEKIFQECCLYMDTMLYAFERECKIIRALEASADAIPDGEMKTLLKRAIDHQQIYDQEDGEEFGMESCLRQVEENYYCGRLHNIHRFLLQAEYYGGNIRQPIHLLLEDKDRWQKRVLGQRREDKHMRIQIILSVLASLLICSMILHMPGIGISIAENRIVSIMTVSVLILDQAIILGAQYYLTRSLLDENKYKSISGEEKEMKSYRQYSPGKELRISALLTIAILPLLVWFIDRRSWEVVLGCLAIMAVFANQHRIGRKLQQKRITRSISQAFPGWLLDMILLLQSENVQVALAKTNDDAPAVLKAELRKLSNELEELPESPQPFHRFLREFDLPQVHDTMSMLYSIAMGNGGEEGEQLEKLFRSNQEMLEEAEANSLKERSSSLYLLFLAPLVTGALKLLVDMTIYLLAFLNLSLM